jgi:hypothetical protein
VFRSCGEVEAFDGVVVVAGEVVLGAVAFLVLAHVVVEAARGSRPHRRHNGDYAEVLAMQSMRSFGQVNGLPSLCVSA